MARQRKEVKLTSIQLTKETKDALKKLGKKGDTYEDIIMELLKK